MCIIGHSGCGRSTILNVLAGLNEATNGDVMMDGREVSAPSIDRGVVLQNYSLLPWLSALRSVTFAVKARQPGWSAEQVKSHALKHLELVGLTGDATRRKPSQLSGGQWWCSYGNENWEFADNGLMCRREASINDLAIAEGDRRYTWYAPGPRPADWPDLEDVPD